MFTKVVKYFLAIFFLGFIAYHAVYFKKLSAIKVSEEIAFDAVAYAKDYVFKKIPSIKNKALDIFMLISELEKDPKKLLQIDAKNPNSSDLKYFFISGQATISEINDEYILLKNIQNDKEVKLAVKYIFGNSARDCSGLISINDFTNTMDLNNVSEEINKLIRKEIVTPFIGKAKKGDLIAFTGAVEISLEEPKLSAIEIVPLTLAFQPSKP